MMSQPSRQKIGKPRLDATQRLLHRFYEPLILLRILDPTRGEQSTRPTSEPKEQSLEEKWHKFLDQLSWVCDSETGGDTVSAIAAQKTPGGPVFWLAANSNPASKALPHLRWVLKQLESIHDPSPPEIEKLEDDITTRCIEFSKNKVRNYGGRLRCNVRKVEELFEKGSHHFGS